MPNSPAGDPDPQPEIEVEVPEDLVERLRGFNTDGFLTEVFYPRLADELAGEQCEPMGVVMGYVLAGNDVTSGQPAVVQLLLLRAFPRLVLRMFDDERSQRHVLDAWRTYTERAGLPSGLQPEQPQ